MRIRTRAGNGGLLTHATCKQPRLNIKLLVSSLLNKKVYKGILIGRARCNDGLEYDMANMKITPTNQKQIRISSRTKHTIGSS